MYPCAHYFTPKEISLQKPNTKNITMSSSLPTSRLSLDVSLKSYDDDDYEYDRYNRTITNTSAPYSSASSCSSVSGDDDIESGTVDSSIDYSYGKPINRKPRSSRKSYLMYGDTAPGTHRRSSTYSVPAVVSKDDGETFQPARRTVSDTMNHVHPKLARAVSERPSRPGLVRAVSKRMSFRNPENSYTESIRRRRKEKTRHSSAGAGESKSSAAMPISPNYDFLTPKEQRDHQVTEGSLLPLPKWWHGIFFFSFVSFIACLVTLWAPYPYGARMPSEMVAQTPYSDGCINTTTCICPRETICADDVFSMILLTLARCSAWFDYPLYMCLFLSKCNNLNNYLQTTVWRCYINFSEYHKVHRLFGVIVGIESFCHGMFHVWRWARRKEDIQLLWSTATGITGIICIGLSWLIILPMILPYLKQHISYEWRKGLHYLSILWAVGLMCHAPQRIFWMMGVPLFMYLVDKMMEIFMKTFLVESAHFERLSDSICCITFRNPPGFGKQNSAYVYLMVRLVFVVVIVIDDDVI